MIACGDGTGSSDDTEYGRVFRRSFVNRIYNGTTQTTRTYHRGPGGDISDGVVGTFGGVHHVSHRFVFQEILTAYNDLSSQISTLTSRTGARTIGSPFIDEGGADGLT